MISIIVPIYKTEPYLKQCLDSILKQTYDDMEILLIDDGSPDRCGEICDEYREKDSRIRVFHTDNHGVSAARNLGIRESRGEYIGFVDSDDWIEPDMFESLLTSIKATGADISVCGYFEEFGGSDRTSQLTETVLEGADVLMALVDGKTTCFVWNKLFRKDRLKGIRFPENVNYEDIIFIYKVMSAAEKISISSEASYHYRIRPGSITKEYLPDNLLDYADAYLTGYHIVNDRLTGRESLYKEKVLVLPARGISKVWRWWHSIDPDKRKQYQGRIKEMAAFSRQNFPLFGCRSWPAYLRITAFFMHSDSEISFSALYVLNQLYRKLFPDRANVIRQETDK